MEVVASLSQGRTAAAQCGSFTHKSVPVIFEPPRTSKLNFAVQEKGCETEEKINLSLRVLKQYAMKRHGGVELWLLASLTWALYTYEEKESSTCSGSFSTAETIQVPND